MVQQDNKHEQKLQAVILADSFTTTFQPMTLASGTPKVLCPLNNVAMLDYSLEFLAGAGVKEMFIFCVNNADKVEEYVQQSTLQYSKAIKIKCIKDRNCGSAGDALRYLDSTNLVRSDPFILMSGDVVTNADIVGALAQHKARRKKDSSAIMTILFHKCGPASKASHRQVDDDLVVGFSRVKEGNRILVYDDDARNSDLSIPTSFFFGNNIQVRNDLVDTGISICSPDVLARFSDEFDYRDIQKQFVRNSVAEEEEGLQNRIYAHFLGDGEYATRVHNPRSYASISRQLLKRWAFPVVPDNPPSGYEKYYRYTVGRKYVYKEVKGLTKIARSTAIGAYTMIGADCTIGENCAIKGTVIGNQCKIDDGVSISDSFLWEEVMIEHDVKITKSILCDGVVIKRGAVIGKGCIIGHGCVVGEDVTLPDFTRLTLTDKIDEDDDFSDDFSSDDDDFSSDDDDFSDDFKEKEEAATEKNEANTASIVGKDGKGFQWCPSTDSDSEDDEEAEDKTLSIRMSSLGFDSTKIFEQRRILREEDAVDELSLSDEEETIGGSVDDSMDAAYSGDVPEQDVDFTMNIVGRQKGVDVVKELMNLILEHEPGTAVENLAIELNSFKFSQNATFADCITATTKAVVKKMNLNDDTPDMEFVKTLRSELKYLSPLYEKFCHSTADEIVIIETFENLALGGENRLKISPAFRFILQTLHDVEVIGEQAIFNWAANHEECDAEKRALFKQEPTQEFLEWLGDASEGESESGSEDSSDDENDD
uniref:Translation initiation factor eIF2B subunit epsilon n=1 Tax=Leptocylindrus danicus TaxID=163516 RepID=A0A7S2JV07_9STRA|mmetsp:Transcript_11918/g.17968  ORF Transcript_11918/g.17968 Transcript_11918/m.17968 type:complete len:764 (+) Transcript_11918:154-2445(+)|eukprot:CAMPEP_0116015660 /NCGR_PEP_ID=MMETSP0321-20121206/6981_1 /TAXON_ID=163516 /ORGANISM="Leptocylindrus danicus var. danicus, Strain B650" /LENGTH=763 /DNA_ID=CAMNT_0003485497 /DNA_START=45 /DNA_END=2336 /DNA_ORIENTATION=+